MIHILRNNAFGDVLEPVARYFIEKGCNVNIITWKDELFANYPNRNLFINKHIPKLQKSILKRITFPGAPKFINLNGAYEANPKMHLLQAYFNKAGIKNTPLSTPRLYLNETEKIRIYSEKYVVLHIEPHQLNYRNVYGVDWVAIVKYLNDAGLRVVQLSKSGKHLYGNRFDAKNFREVISLIYNCDMFIGVDSGPSHIAACFNKPCIIFFGAVNPFFRHLPSDNKFFLQKPCKYAGCYHETNGKRNPVCKISGNEGIPKCCLHSTDFVIDNISQLYNDYLK